MQERWPDQDKRDLIARYPPPTPTEQDYTRYQTDPTGYATDVLGVTLTPDQAAILTGLVGDRYTLVMASHAVGKTFVAAVAACWWYDCWDSHIVYVTAPTWPQALGLTFKEIKRLRRAHTLPGRVLDSGSIKDPANPEAHFIRALNAETGEGFQGEHSAPILLILEEGPGVPHYIWEAGRGLMTHPDCKTFVIGNPTDEATDFGSAASNPTYATRSISALDHPNIAAELVAAQPPPYPAAVRLIWVYEMLRDECEIVDTLTEDCFSWVALPEIAKALDGTPADTTQRAVYKPNADFQGRVLGMFPTQASSQVIPRAWLALPDPPLVPTGPVEIGCDVARFGDDRSTIFVRRGGCALAGRELRQYDGLAVATACKDLADEWGGDAAQHVPIKIDVTGGLGAGPYDFLKSWGYHAVAVNSSEAATDPAKYVNRRSELWFVTREWARDRTLDLSRLPADLRERLMKELSAPTWKPDEKSRKVVEPKATLKKRIGVSPDLADGFNLSYYAAPTIGVAWL